MNITGGQDPLVLAASILATAINGAQQQHQNAIQVTFFYQMLNREGRREIFY